MAIDGEAEHAVGESIEIIFDGSLCIHSRFCVLQAPEVFAANVEGPWIFPDRLPADYIASVARNCPSGAISYRSADPILSETLPSVNTMRLRENGPYAVNADLRLGKEKAQRRTFCRCGASKNKPFCDGSHAEIGFSATGEPPTSADWQLDARHGPLKVTPLPNGPLEVIGPLEIVSGTGRTIARTEKCLLCRCGGSQAKPFCDGTHSRNGFSDSASARPELEKPAPELADWIGGRDVFHRLTTRFYERVADDVLLADLFASASPHHAGHVADFLTEVLGGEQAYTDSGGSHVGMILHHVGRNITEDQRQRWVALLLETAEAEGLANDAAFVEAFEAYLDWGSRLAVINSSGKAPQPEGPMPMPHWGWGPARGSGSSEKA